MKLLYTLILLLLSCSTQPEDCAGVAGGTAEEDMCGVCDTYLTNDCLPDGHSYNSSMLQAFYFFSSVTLDGMLIDSNDWVIAVNDSVVVGSHQWDTSICNGICAVPAMGDNGSDDTAGYMQTGGVPSFVIYDTSSDTYYQAITSEPIDVWSNSGIFINDSLQAFTQ